METESKQQPQTDVDSPATSASRQLRDRKPLPSLSLSARSPEDSPASSLSSLSSLSHRFSPERPEPEQQQQQPEASHGSPPLDPLPELPAERVTSPTPVPMVNRYVREETPTVTKADYGARDGFVRRPEEEVRAGGGGVGGGGGGGRRFRSGGRRADKEGSMRKIALGFRVFELLFCLVSLSVMATDKRQGWALDSYYRYKEFRYSMGVNVIGFAYAVLQGCDLAYQLATGNHSSRRHNLRYYFDFAMDQMLTYLLISSGSSAATRVDDWKSNWGADKFPELATASVGLGFAAFVAFAFSSVISGYSLYTATSS
ncbi:putative casparian strip membrane protein [Helianthus annuus]|nr:putative casparian strip membrane protein [Helianthus annuus]KAJ0712492.1 putative casparian strip membrane protein [Helianthus annuus]KAJ0894404.1 putative casparian strip membrane protein [Helianthus annuus]